MRLKSGGDWTSVYRGTNQYLPGCNQTTQSCQWIVHRCFPSSEAQEGEHPGVNLAGQDPYCCEVCSELGISPLGEPRVHCSWRPSMSSILLDHNLVAKIYGFRLARCYDDSVAFDVFAFGSPILRLLTGRNWQRLVEATMAGDDRA
ncbi:hypothetical protein RJ641_009757 [Dillenia turbinata]|uniref:Uncharacterized protein n=1 Tax=Dillenia turbinata TaxID=194707 RepID=A0AAN8V8G8_9MAGN